jgi:muconolactone delta-isomerase
MKFLVFTSPNEDGLKTPPAVDQFDAQTEWFRQRLADGTLDCAYHGDDRAVFIFNAASPEALQSLIADIPLADRMQSEIEPLIDLFEHTERISGYLKGLEASQGR